MDSYTFTYPWLPAHDNHRVSCCLCNGIHPTEDVFSFSINSEPYAVRRCTKDDLMFLSPQPGEAFLHALYNHPSYFTGEDDMYGLAVNDEKSTQVAKIRIDEIKKYYPHATSLLEIGCGYGHTLVEAKKSGFSISDGIEFSEDAVAHAKAKGVNVVLGSANSAFPRERAHKTYDVIALYSVLEHLADPVEFLRQIKPHLATRGILVIRVPRMSSHGPWLSLLDHLWHFTELSLKNMAEKNGFFVQEVFPSGTFQGTQHVGELKSMTAIISLII